MVSDGQNEISEVYAINPQKCHRYRLCDARAL